MVEEGGAAEAPIAGVANPAAVYCEGLGYTTESRETEAGMDAACIFPDGAECGQWDFLSGRCGQEYTYCLQQGGVRLEEGANIGACVFEDGSTCDEYMFYLGECGPGVGPADSGDSDAAPPPPDAPAITGVTVVGWMGYVRTAPTDGQFDDYVVILPEGEGGSFGIAGATEEVEPQIIALRDHEPPGMYAHFWGVLTCDAIDYNGCQLLVDRLRVDGPGAFFDPDPVEGWEGSIVDLSSGEPGSGPDDAFVLMGGYPVQYGIDSAIAAESGERDLADVVVGLRDGGQLIRIWGEVTCGVPDAGGCHIEAYRIETGSEVYEITPVE